MTEDVRPPVPGMLAVDIVTYTAHQIEREDGLISNRLTWMLTFQGFLFLSAAAVLAANVDPYLRQVFVTSTAVVGFLVCIIALLSIAAAVASIDRICGCWEDIRKTYELDEMLVPRPFGHLPDAAPRRWPNLDKGHWIAYGIPLSVMAGWIGVGVAGLFAG